MPTPLTTLASLAVVHTGGVSAVVMRGSTVPESAVLFLLGGGLVVLAGLVRRYCPLAGEAAPKSFQFMVWIAPEEFEKQLGSGNEFEDAVPDADLSPSSLELQV